MYSNINKSHFRISKVIIGRTGMDNAINDYNCNYRMTQDSFEIIIDIKDEGDNIINFIL